MNTSKKILILALSFFVFVQHICAQKKAATEAKKTTKQLKTTKEIAEIEKQIKDAEKVVDKKTTNSKKTTAKKKPATKEETDTTAPSTKATGQELTGTASFYSASFEGKQTANGEIFRNAKLTCASNKFPLGTWLKITNLKNNKTIVVKVNDRMHPRMKRLVDLTLTGAKKLDFVAAGLTQVKAEVLKKK
jgi:rare lipoprotein A (peptidoglycan hydrolase)